LPRKCTNYSACPALRIGRFIERQGLLERDAKNRYLAADDLDARAMGQLLA
jgi:hypothetical protein